MSGERVAWEIFDKQFLRKSTSSINTRVGEKLGGSHKSKHDLMHVSEIKIDSIGFINKSCISNQVSNQVTYLFHHLK